MHLINFVACIKLLALTAIIPFCGSKFCYQVTKLPMLSEKPFFLSTSHFLNLPNERFRMLFHGGKTTYSALHGAIFSPQ